MSNKVLFLYIAGLLVLSALINFLIMRHSRRRIQRLREERTSAEAHRRAQENARQTNIGNRIFNRLNALAKELGREDMLVVRMPDNGGAYSVFVGRYISSFTTYACPGYPGVPVVHVYTMIANCDSPCIRTAWGPYPKDDPTYGVSEEEILGLLSDLENYLRKYFESTPSALR